MTLPPTESEPCLVVPQGRVDALTAPALEAQLAAVQRDHPGIVTADLSNITYLSSSGLRVLLLAQRRQQSLGGRLLFCNPSPKALYILQMAGLDRILTLVPSCPPGETTPKG